MNISFVLPKKLPYFKTFATQGNWHCFYLDANSAIINWQTQDANGMLLTQGNWNIPPDVLAIWGTDNSVVTDALILAAPYDVS